MRQRPNIVLFLTDDHGQWASNSYGATELHTPAMDQLADTGARMTRAFTPSPVCSPARACLFTARFPSQHGIHDWLETWGVGRGHPGLDGQTTLAALLHDAGYQTALIGKWHCGHENVRQPGFDRWFTFDQGYQFPHRGQIRLFDQTREVIRSGQSAQIITDQAMQFLHTRDRERPYFLTVSHVSTHSPFDEQPQRLVAHYGKCGFSAIPNDVRPGSYASAVRPDFDDPDERRKRLAQYYAAVTFVDEQVGRIMDHVEGCGELENTLIVYTSDHGHMNGHHRLWCKGNATTPQNFLDESILVPCLLSWPARIAAGQVRDEMVDHCDLSALLLDAASVAMRDEQARQINSPGRSYLPLLEGRSSGPLWRRSQVCEYGNARMIRTDHAKLIRRYRACGRDWPDEFYDLRTDPRETQNVIDDPVHLSKIAELSAKLDAFFARYTVQGRAGPGVTDQPVCNDDEPWRRAVETQPLKK